MRVGARVAGLAAALAAASAFALPANARPRSAAFLLAQTEPLAQLFPAQRGGGISLAQATSMAQSRYQGRVVRAETVQMGDRIVHEIRILDDDGRVRTVRVDAQTGAFM
jgi:hypothetical protein